MEECYQEIVMAAPSLRSVADATKKR